MKDKINQLDFDGQAIYIGLDVHDKQWKVTSATKDLIFNTFTQPPESLVLSKYLKRNFPGGEYYAVYEAGCFGFWIKRQLESLGIKTIVVNPGDVPTSDKERRQKEDKRDSRKLVKSLRGDELEPIHVPSRKTEEDRHLIRVRTMFSKDSRRYKNRIKSMLKYYGIKLPIQFSSNGTHWSKNFMDWLRSVELEEVSGNYAFMKLIEQCEKLRLEILEITQEVRKLSKTEYYKNKVQLLLSIPGIGLIFAMVLLTELENISRFKDLSKLASYTGLVPSTSGSGDKEGVGEITPRKNKYLRSLLIEAAWIATKCDPALSLKYIELCKRMKKNRAIIIIAKKLLNRIRYVLKNEKEYKKAVIL